jgi:hypothetical protein
VSEHVPTGIAPAVVIAFEFERRPRIVNIDELSALPEGDLVRLFDWISNRRGRGAVDLEAWLRLHLRQREAAA